MAAPVYGGHDIRHGQFLSYYSFTKSHMLIEVGPVNKIDTVIAFRSFFFLKFPGLLNLPAREKFILFMVSHKFFSKNL